jgi:hypothetical protein
MLAFLCSLVLICLGVEFARYIVKRARALEELENAQNATYNVHTYRDDMVSWFFSTSDTDSSEKNGHTAHSGEDILPTLDDRRRMQGNSDVAHL